MMNILTGSEVNGDSFFLFYGRDSRAYEAFYDKRNNTWRVFMMRFASTERVYG